jgi:hypothetical protein
MLSAKLIWTERNLGERSSELKLYQKSLLKTKPTN